MCVLCGDRVKTGLFCSSPGVAIARSMPSKAALHMLLTAEPLTAHGLSMHVLYRAATHLENLEKSGKMYSCTHEICPIGSQENH